MMMMPSEYNRFPDPLPYPPDMSEAYVQTYKTIGDLKLNLWIYTPPEHHSSDKRPAIVFFYGGGWAKGSPMQFRHHCAFLAARGIVAIAADYRVSDRHGTQINTCVTDAKSAMRWVRSHADRLGIDPNRLASGGSSAGGYLAAATAMLPGHDDPLDDLSISAIPNAQVLFNPVVLLAPIQGGLAVSETLSDLIEGRLGADAIALSPYHHIKSDMGPTVIFHGMADEIVPYESVRIFRDTMVDRGNRCDLIGYRGAAHGFFNLGRDSNASFADTMHKMDVFLISIGYLNGVESETCV